MTLLQFLDNIKRKSSRMRLFNQVYQNVFDGTISEFSHWIHNQEYYHKDINIIYVDDNFYDIRLKN